MNESRFNLGPLGAMAVTVVEGVVVPEARVSIIGNIPQWDWTPHFEEA